MPRRFLTLAFALAFTIALGGAALAPACSHQRPFRFATELDNHQPFHYDLDLDAFKLANGLRVVLAPEPSTNLVAVDVRYQVGAADEPAGKTGLAHLVEHLTFAAGAPGKPSAMERLSSSALSFNGYTTADETHYTEVALAMQWPELLDVEAARMGLDCAGLTSVPFDHERGVVAEELTQRQSAALDPLLAAVFGADHPYGHSAGGTDLATLTRDDACAFVTAHYAPDRAFLVVSGNFDRARVRADITARFGALTRTGAPPVPIAPLDALPGAARIDLVADLDTPTLVLAIPAPQLGSDEAVYHEVLANAAASALDAIDRERADVISTEVRAVGGDRGGATLLALSLSKYADPDDVATAVRDKLTHVLSDRSPLLIAVQRGYVYARRLARYEDVTSRGAMIADYLQFATADLHVHDLEVARDLTNSALRAYAAHTFLAPDIKRIVIMPDAAHHHEASLRLLPPATAPDLPPSALAVDVAEAHRALVVPPAAAAPFEEVKLDNGLRVLFAPQPASARFEARLIFPAGAADEPRDRAGTARYAAHQLDYDFDRGFNYATQAAIVAGLQTGTTPDDDVRLRETVFSTSGVASYAAWHLWWLHLRIESGKYDPVELARIQRDPADKDADARAVVRKIADRLFGPGNPLARDPSATPLTADELNRFRDAHYLADGATLIIAGNFDRAAIEHEVRELWGAWPRVARPVAAALPPPAPAAGPTIFVRDDDDLPQLHVRVAFLARSDASSTAARMVARELIDLRLGAIRDEMAASYGIYAHYARTGDGDLVAIEGDLDGARGAAALGRLEQEIAGLYEGADQLAADFVRARRAALRTALAEAGSAEELADEAEAITTRGLPIDHFARLPGEVGAVTPAQVAALLHGDLDPTRMVVLVTGRGARASAEAAHLAPLTDLPKPAARH